MEEARCNALSSGEGEIMAIGFDIREGSTQRGIVKALIAVALVFGLPVEDMHGLEEKILAGLFALEGLIGMFVREKGGK